MSFQNNNNYTTAPTFPNSYISRKLNNMDQAQVMKREREDWTRLYYKILKEIEAMIDVQRLVKDLKKIAEETNMMIMEIEGTILMASINNQIVNTYCMKHWLRLHMVQPITSSYPLPLSMLSPGDIDHNTEVQYIC